MESNYGAFMDQFKLHPSVDADELPLGGLTFAIKDIFDVEGYVTGFGNPDWVRTHSPAKSTAPVVSALLKAGATSIGKTVMDELAYSINGENFHYGTPRNPCAQDRVPGGSSSGSAVAVGANLVDFSLGTDTGGSVRVPAAFCKIYGIRPSHGVISVDGVVPMAQSFDTVGWFARDPTVLKRVGQVLLPPVDMSPLDRNSIFIAEDCFKLLSIPIDRVQQVLVDSVKKLFGALGVPFISVGYGIHSHILVVSCRHGYRPIREVWKNIGGEVLSYMTLGDYVEENVPSLKHFMIEGNDRNEYRIQSLAALSSAMRILQRYEFKNNHSEWITSVQPSLGPGIKERVWEAVRSSDSNVDLCRSVKSELRAALTSLLGESGILVIPTVPGPPPKLQMEPTSLETFRARAFSLLSIAGVSGFCQVSVPLGTYEDLPVSVSLLAKHGSDLFLLELVKTLSATLENQTQIAELSRQ